MRLRLKWQDTNVNPHTVTIYRSDTLPTSNPTGPGVVTLTEGETQWDDTTVVRGNVYWYTYKVSNGKEDLYSVPLRVTALPRTGPGPQTLIDGDLELGYYGTVTQAEMFGYKDLHTLLNAGTMNSDPQPLRWEKFARNGKTLFITPDRVTQGVSWLQLYAKGLVYGVAGPGPVTPLPQAAVEQYTVIAKGIDRFIVRLPTGFDDRNNPTRVTPADLVLSNVNLQRRYGELADLFYSLLNVIPACVRFTRKPPHAALSTNGWTVSTGRTWTQEIDPVAKTSVTNIAATTEALMGTGNPDVLTSSNGWRPVLELIEQTDLEVML